MTDVIVQPPEIGNGLTAAGVVAPESEAPSRPGLLRDAITVTVGSDIEDGDRWISGFSFDPDPCGGGHIVDPCQLSDNINPAETTTCIAVSGIQPYNVEASEKTSTFYNRPQDRRDRVRRKLLGVQSKVIEAEFWSGTKAVSQGWTNNQYLTKAAGLTVLSSGQTHGLVDGLAALEQAIADGSSWEQGAIHASWRLVTHWLWNGLVNAEPNPRTGTLMTDLGTVVIAGAGYPGTGPGGVAPQGDGKHLQWAYATPLPRVRLGEVHDSGTNDDVVAVDRSTNDRTTRAWRAAAVTVSECFRAGVLVNLLTERALPGS